MVREYTFLLTDEAAVQSILCGAIVTTSLPLIGTSACNLQHVQGTKSVLSVRTERTI